MISRQYPFKNKKGTWENKCGMPRCLTGAAACTRSSH
jgi:hypothetical protein